MSELHQAEDIRQLSEKVREQNYFFTLLKQEINKAIIGQEYMVDRLLIGLLGNGHVLFFTAELYLDLFEIHHAMDRKFVSRRPIK